MSLKPLPIQKIFSSEQLVILTCQQTARVRFINRMSRIFPSMDWEPLGRGEDFYKRFLHPEDYSDYIAHLNSLALDEEKETELRFRNRQGNWSRFCFRNRFYKGMSDQGGPLVLSRAYEMPENGKQEKEASEPEAQQPLDNELKHLVESLDDAFCVVELLFDEEGNPVDYLFVQTNPAFEKQNPYYKNVEGKTLREVHPDRKEKNFTQLRQVAEKGEATRYQLYIEELEKTWYEIYAFKVGPENSSRVAMIFRNITQNKMAEQELLDAKAELEKAKAALEERAIRTDKALQQSRELLQTVFDTTNQAVAVFRTLYDTDGSIRDFRFLKVNKVLLEMYLEQDPTGLSYLETTKYGVEIGIFDALKRVMETGTPLDEEFYFDKENYDHWFRLTARPQNDLLIATIEDITERKLQALKSEENQRFRHELGKTSMETILILNLSELKVRYINRDLFPEVGITRERVEGMPLLDILPYIHPRDREKLMGLHYKIVKASSEEVFEVEIRAKVKDTSWEWFNVRGKIFLRRDPKWVEEYVLLITNITQQKNTEKALLEAEKLSIKGEIARTLGHELRNPIASIGMVGQVLAKKLGKGGAEESKKYLEILARSSRTLNNLVTNLLNSSNYSPAVLKQEDLAGVVERSIERASDRIYLAGVKLTKDFYGPYLILADPDKLEIALLNILVNASEACMPGEGKIEVRITETKTDYMLTITDNGCGLEEEQIGQLFNAFYTSKALGLGVGLSSVKNILEEHDAQIKVKSKINEGTTFKLSFSKCR